MVIFIFENEELFTVPYHTTYYPTYIRTFVLSYFRTFVSEIAPMLPIFGEKLRMRIDPQDSQPHAFYIYT